MILPQRSGVSCGNLEDEFRVSADDQTRSRPGRVSEPHGEKKHILANFELISARIGKILFKTRTRLSIRGTGTTSGSVTRTYSALRPTVNHHIHHHSS